MEFEPAEIKCINITIIIEKENKFKKRNETDYEDSIINIWKIYSKEK